MAGFTPLPDVGDNAFDQGALNRQWLQDVIDRLNAFCNWQITADSNFGVDCSTEGITERIQQELPILTQAGTFILSNNGQLVSWIPAPPGVYHNYTIQDDGTSTSHFIVTNGNHLDTTNNTTWIPSNINTAIDGTGNTLAYFDITVNDLTGAPSTNPGRITALIITAGTSVPTGTSTHQYQLVANYTINGAGLVTTTEGGVSASQATAYCVSGQSLQIGRQ